MVEWRHAALQDDRDKSENLMLSAPVGEPSIPRVWVGLLLSERTAPGDRLDHHPTVATKVC